MKEIIHDALNRFFVPDSSMDEGFSESGDYLRRINQLSLYIKAEGKGVLPRISKQEAEAHAAVITSWLRESLLKMVTAEDFQSRGNTVIFLNVLREVLTHKSEMAYQKLKQSPGLEE